VVYSMSPEETIIRNPDIVIPSASAPDGVLAGPVSFPDIYIPWSVISDFLANLWSVYSILSYLFSIFLLVLFVYASTRFKQLQDIRLAATKEKERIYDENFRSGPKNNRMLDVMKHVESDNPNDWKLAIIEADIILDKALKNAGFVGASLGDRLKSISPGQLNSIDDAWQAHKVRNQIAHDGADFVLTRRMAEDTIRQYRRVFVELGELK
jgi:hypothetical protein